eukprot:100171_1
MDHTNHKPTLPTYTPTYIPTYIPTNTPTFKLTTPNIRQTKSEQQPIIIYRNSTKIIVLNANKNIKKKKITCTKILLIKFIIFIFFIVWIGFFEYVCKTK